MRFLRYNSGNLRALFSKQHEHSVCVDPNRLSCTAGCSKYLVTSFPSFEESSAVGVERIVVSTGSVGMAAPKYSERMSLSAGTQAASAGLVEMAASK